MTKFFVDDEKVGWSFVIGTDLSIGPQWLEWDQYPRDERGLTDYSKIGPQSYTARGEMPHSDDPSGDWIVANEDNIFIEWAYVLNAAGLLVVRGTNKPIALVPWDVEEPMKVMDEIEAGTYVSV